MTRPADSPPPNGYRETFRGHVPAWECDDVEHFTVAFYFERLERASARFLTEQGLDVRALGEVAHRDFYVRYARELRVSSVFLIQTGIIGREGSTLHLGHRVIDLADGHVCTTIEHWLEGDVLVQIDDTARIDWDGPVRDNRTDLGNDAPWLRTGTDIVMPSESDWGGRLRISGFAHRFSASGGELMTRFGWTPQYEDEHRIGFSTFEFQLRLADSPCAGESLDIEACLAHIGRSSVHIVHRVLETRSRRTLAVLHQLGVHLDKDARRPSPMPEHIKAAAMAAVAV